MEKNTTLQSLFEALDNGEIGDVSEFEQPGVKPEDEWKFADPETVMTEDYVIDMAADMLVDCESVTASKYFQLLGRVLAQHTDSGDLEEIICNEVRALARQQLLDIYEGEITEGAIRPVSNAEITRDLEYLFKQLIKVLRTKFGAG